jgi:parallel beta-helix repeat protein
MEGTVRRSLASILVGVAVAALLTASAIVGNLAARSENPQANSRETLTSQSSSLAQINAILSHRPVLLFFYADWCHYCQQQMPIIDEVEQEYGGRVSFIRINVEEEPRLQQDFGVEGYPTVIIISGNSGESYDFEKFRGLTTRESLEAAIERGMRRFKEGASSEVEGASTFPNSLTDAACHPGEAANKDAGHSANLNNASTKTKFEGTVIQNLSMTGEWHFVVSGLTWTGGVEPCADPIHVKKQVIEGCEGYVDPSVGVGHEVEVYGDLPFGGCWVSLCEPDSYIIKKTAAECCPCQIGTRDPTAELGYPHPAHNTDVIVYFAPECSDTVCGLVTACFPWVHIERCGIHGVDYYVVADNPIPYNDLSGHVGNYVRLTGVAIEDYGILGDPFISGYDTSEEISGCSACESEYCDPASFSAWLDGTTNITGDFYKYSEGIYRATVAAGEPGNKTIEVSAPNCTTLERELHLVGSTICGEVDWWSEGASIEGCDGLTYQVASCDGLKWQELHNRLEDYDGENVSLSSVVFEGYYDANTTCIADFDDVLEISDCSECYSDRFIDGCAEISSPGDYILTYDIHESTAQECIRITASNVTFDGNGHYISAAEIIDGGPLRYAVRVGSSSTLSNVTVNDTYVQADWDIGIGFGNVTDGKIENNNIGGEEEYGIQLVNCSNCNITGNDVSDNQDGICLMNSDNNDISDNAVELNYSGIALFWSSGNNITGNTAQDNVFGIDLYQNSNNNTISNNTVEHNLQHGLYFEANCSGNTISENTACSNNEVEGDYHDIHDENGTSGKENTCDTTYDYNDANTTGCAHWCDDWDKDGVPDANDACPQCASPYSWQPVLANGCSFAGYHGYAFTNSEGKCFGMSRTAAMYYNGDLSIPGRSDNYLYEATENMDPADATNKTNWTADENNIWENVTKWHDSLGYQALKGKLASTGPGLFVDELDKIKSDIDNNKVCVVGLGYSNWLKTGDLHAVAAYAYNYNGPAGTMNIAIYDPNYHYCYGQYCYPTDCGFRTIDVSLSRTLPGTDKYTEARFNYHGYDMLQYASAEEAWYEKVGGYVANLNPLSGAELHAYDSQGHHTGPDGQGGIEEQIPGSEYEIDEATGAQTLIIPSEGEGNFTFEVRGTSSGKFNMAITEVCNSTARIDVYRDVPLTALTLAQREVGPGSDRLLRVDEDSDGVFEMESDPDSSFADSDGDDLSDDWESQYGTQVNVPDAGDDPDDDGLTNYQEYMRGTHPLDPDTDDDGVLDGLDVCHGYDDSSDCDGDGIPDGCDVPPVISNVDVPNQTTNAATVVWDTNIPSDSLVKYGTEPGVYNWQEHNPSLTTFHVVPLSGLEADTKYYYVVGSTDEGGNPSESIEYDFTTLGTRGDANEDTVVNMADVTKVERIILMVDARTPQADANDDGVVNMADATKIERIILGLDSWREMREVFAAYRQPVSPVSTSGS